MFIKKYDNVNYDSSYEEDMKIKNLPHKENMCYVLCSKNHKKMFKCTQKLKKNLKIKNVSKGNFDESILYKDFLYLQNIETIIRGNYKYIKVKNYETTNIWLLHNKMLIKLLKKRKIILLKAPIFTKIHKENKTFIYNHILFWTIKITFVNLNIRILHHEINENLTFLQIIQYLCSKIEKLQTKIFIYLQNVKSIYVSLNNEQPNKARKNLNHHQNKNTNNDNNNACDMKKYCSVQQVLRKSLCGKSFYEYPHFDIEILYEDNKPIVNPLYELEHKKEEDNQQNCQQEGSIGNTIRMREGGEDNKEGDEDNKEGDEDNKEGDEHNKEDDKDNKENDENNDEDDEDNDEDDEDNDEGDEGNDKGDEYNDEGDEYNDEGDEYNDEGDEYNDEGDEYNDEGDEYNDEGDEYNDEGDEYNDEGDEYNDEDDNDMNNNDKNNIGSICAIHLWRHSEWRGRNVLGGGKCRNNDNMLWLDLIKKNKKVNKKKNKNNNNNIISSSCCCCCCIYNDKYCFLFVNKKIDNNYKRIKKKEKHNCKKRLKSLNNEGGFSNTYHNDVKKNTLDYCEERLPSYHRYIDNLKTRKIIHPSIRIRNLDKKFMKCKESYNKLYSHLKENDLFENFSYVGRQKKGILSPTYRLPKYIERPNYHKTGIPIYVPYDKEKKNNKTNSDHNNKYDHYNCNYDYNYYDNIKSDKDIQIIKENCKFARELMDDVSYIICEGITTNDIDIYILNKCINNGFYPSPLNYHNFPKSSCISINEILCHGIPDNNLLYLNDVVKIDISLFRNGYHADMCESFIVPKL
ncbi:methionine aminopeptidase, partial [Plasmodium falciparum IGH-CR14]